MKYTPPTPPTPNFDQLPNPRNRVERTPEMQFRQVTEQPYTYIVEDDYGKQLGTVDEFHPSKTPWLIKYVARRFDGRGMFEERTFSGFTAALQFVEKGIS